MKFDKDVEDSVIRFASTLLGGSFGPQSLSGMVIAAAILQASKDLTQRLDALTQAMGSKTGG